MSHRRFRRHTPLPSIFMDTRTRSASPNTAADDHAKHATPPPVQDKISAYYSLVFPHFTFYIQTLSITIGRRCAPNAATSSTSEHSQVDVDLGALKSVSRLHAKIEYDQDEDRFVLVVIGRNGAWVDGVWSGSGTRTALSERSQIQIASRTFHFVLPPPPPPEDTPSPSSQSSANRQRSPSVDITSISPPSSQPSHSPPPPEVKRPPPSLEPQAPPKPKPKPKAQPQPPPQPLPELPNSNSIGKSTKVNAKKRKKGDVDPPPILERPKPEDIPPKPPFTYAQLIYRAIKDIGGKATLQEICNWIMNTHEYYRYADGSWMSSVRHNLSSGRAFLKGDRCGGDRGKGFFWSVDERYSQTLEEQELKVQQAAAAASQGATSGGAVATTKIRKKDKGALLEPALKRSVKGDMKGAPLPPPLTSSPLTFKTIVHPTPAPSAAITAAGSASASASGGVIGSTPATTGVFAYPSHPQRRVNLNQQASTTTSIYSGMPLTGPNPYAALAQPDWATHPNVGGKAHSASTPATGPSSSAQPPVSQPPLAVQTTVPDVIIPIVLGPIPPTHPDYAPGHPNNSAKEGYMVLHERKLILDPDVFAELTKEMLEQLEKMGAPTALSILMGHMIRALKERRARERGKERARRPKGAGRGGARKAAAVTTAPFTNVPLDQKRKLANANAAEASSSGMTPGGNVDINSPTIATRGASTPANPPPDAAPPPPPSADPGSPLIVVDDDSGDEGPAAKKRKVDTRLAVPCF
ncbi:unnamed protein product [Cyclocybe aegerita]|uniref:Uncharacterized protein n=1 Tax=Cyclocybe aegerita TaxID=1973307 RepID=A0A8S0W2W2_CYCAE|nr:unnamed protein product [Cyclocybe aegerita]